MESEMRPWFNTRREEILIQRRKILDEIASLGSKLQLRQTELGILAAQYQDLYHLNGVEQDKGMEVDNGKVTGI